MNHLDSCNCIGRLGWRRDFGARPGKAKEPSALEVEFTFKDGTVRTIPATLESDEYDFWICRKVDRTPEDVEASEADLSLTT